MPLVLACQERLASPADCPSLCPGSFDVRDTVLYALDDGDSTYTGYLTAGRGNSLRVSRDFPASEDRALVRFAARPDSFLVGDSARAYVIDSVRLELSILYRDTTVHGLKVYLYRLPVSVDSTTTFAEVEAAFVPSAIIDSISVDDTLRTARLGTTLKDADLAKVAIPEADSGVMAIGIQIRADAPTGVRLGGSLSGSSTPTFRSFVSVQDVDTTYTRTFTPSIRFNTFVSQASPAPDQSVLTVGGAPSSRSVIRFPWPALLRDSAQLVRATLELIPAVAMNGLPGDTAYLVVRPALADLGGKSSTSPDDRFAAFVGVVPGDVDPLGFEVRRALLAWQGEDGLPPMFMVQMLPEASSFTTARFGSTRSGPELRPRLRVTYTLTYPFGNP